MNWVRLHFNSHFPMYYCVVFWKILAQLTSFVFQGNKPWWKSNFFISEPVLFGQWDGVFTSCLINIFGVIVFLRSGWMVAQAGILNAVLIVVATGISRLISLVWKWELSEEKSSDALSCGGRRTVYHFWYDSEMPTNRNLPTYIT